MDQESLKSIEELLLRYRDGDKDAFLLFFRKTKTPLYSFLLNKLRNQQAAEEVLQDTFLKIHRFAHRYDSHQGKIFGWLFTIAQNCAMDYLRKKWPNSIPLELSEDKDRAQNELQSVASILEHYGERLSEDEKALLLDRFEHELSFEEIAQKHVIKTDNARQKLSRTLRKLRNPWQNPK